MLLFSTILDIKDSLTEDGFVNLILEWNSTASRAANIIRDIEWSNSYGTRFGSDSLWLQIEKYDEKCIVAARHEKIDENGAVWDTDYVMNFAEMRMSIRLDRSYQAESFEIGAEFSTPHFITLLINHGYLSDDAGLPILKHPVETTDESARFLKLAENGSRPCTLPIVRVSKTTEGNNPVDVGLLASRLKGIAHVFVRESSEGTASDGLPKCGDVEIFFPGTPSKRLTVPFQRDDAGGAAQFASTLRPVVQYSNSKAIDPLYTWDGVHNALLLEKLDRQRSDFEKREKDSDAFIESFGKDYDSLEKQLRELMGRNAALEVENASLRAKAPVAAGSTLLVTGSERDFFEGEIKDLVLSTLVEALKGIPASSRRHDVVSDVVKNNGYRGECHRRAGELEKLIKGNKPTSDRLGKGLEKLGFVNTSNRKHLKARYFGDARYQITFAKTPSDIRAAANTVSDFVRKVY